MDKFNYDSILRPAYARSMEIEPMRIAKINTIAYDPDSKTLSFTGLNRFSRPRQGSVFIDDEVKFIETIHQLLANPDKSSVDFAAELKSETEKKSKKSSSDKIK